MWLPASDRKVQLSCVTLGRNFTIGPYATIGPNVTVYLDVIFEVKALSAGDLRWGSKNMPLPSVHLTLCIYIFLSLVHFEFFWEYVKSFSFLGGWGNKYIFKGLYMCAATMYSIVLIKAMFPQIMDYFHPLTTVTDCSK